MTGHCASWVQDWRDVDPRAFASIPGFHPDDQGSYATLVPGGVREGQISWGFAVFEPGETHMLHQHPNADELYIALDRPLAVRIGNREDSIQFGQTAYIPRGVEHMIENNGTEPARMLYVFGMDEAMVEVAYTE